MKKLLFVFVLSIISINTYAQKEFNVDGVIVPRTMTFLNKTVQLNGIGKRSKMWIEVYTQALYLTRLSQDAKDILNSDTEMAMRIEITSAMVSTGKFSRSVNNGLIRSVGKDIEVFRPRIDAFIAMLKDEIVKGDVFVMFYNPIDKSLWIYKNDVLKGKIVGKDFMQAYYGIWLCEKPIDTKLKDELLGKI
jgi:Chalcone isomerase-like